MFRKGLYSSARKTIQGMSERMEKTKPIIPAVEGMLIRIPLIKPMMPIFLGRSLFKRA
jgi:hypothetical protein